MPMGKGTYGSKVGRPPKKMMYGGKVNKMKDGGKLKMVDRNGKSVPFYANDGVGKMNKGGKVKKMEMGGGLMASMMRGMDPMTDAVYKTFSKPSEKMRGMNADADKAEGQKVANEINKGGKPKTIVVAEYDVGIKGKGRKSKQTSGKKVAMKNKGGKIPKMYY